MYILYCIYSITNTLTVRLNGGLSYLDSFLDFEIIGSVVILRKTSIKIDFKVKIVENIIRNMK